MKYDYLIVGSGFFGSICAYELTNAGYNCLVLEKRNHIGGNCFTEQRDDINIHTYGPHIFHTSNSEVWEWINQFVEFNNFQLRPVANYNNEIYSLPFNMWTFAKLFNVYLPDDVKNIIQKESNEITHQPLNLEEQAIKLVGRTVYEKLIKGYTKKQWRKDPTLLPPDIIKRLPVRLSYDNNYFNDKYQGIPIGGYTQIFDKLLENIDVKLNIDYLQEKSKWDSLACRTIYTGPIDKFYDYRFGELEYKTTRFKHLKIEKPSYQGTAMMNFTHEMIPYTRIIEHKYFDYIDCNHTWITYEYPTNYISNISEPYYPVNDEINNNIYKQYKILADAESRYIFGGRLAEYKYYDMHQVIESALTTVKHILKQ